MDLPPLVWTSPDLSPDSALSQTRPRDHSASRNSFASRYEVLDRDSSDLRWATAPLGALLDVDSLRTEYGARGVLAHMGAVCMQGESVHPVLPINKIVTTLSSTFTSLHAVPLGPPHRAVQLTGSICLLRRPLHLRIPRHGHTA